MLALVSLPRMKEPPKAADQVSSVVALELKKAAESLLDYKGFSAADRPAIEAADRLNKKHALCADLIRIGIAPFQDEAVKKYMNQAVNKKRMLVWIRGIIAPIAIISFYSLVFFFGVSSRTSFGFFVTGTVISAFAMIVWGDVVLKRILGDGYKWRWNEVRLVGYTKPIPVHIIETAIRVKKELGDKIYFSVLEFSSKRQVGDPFLVVYRNGAYAYIAVWDEPSFRAN